MSTPFLRGAVRALIALALTASTLVAAGTTSAQAEVILPIHHIRIRAVLLADNDGSRAPTITTAQIKSTVDTANTVWKDAGIVFDFDPATDVQKVNSTLMNNDCTIINASTCDKNPNTQAREAYALSSARDGVPSGTGWAGARVTVFYRYGGDEVTCSTTCTNKESGWNFSSRAGHYVVMMRKDIGKFILAHELGHYFWNKHTFGSQPATISAAATKIREYVAAGNSKDLGLRALDGDWDETSDTPADAGTAIWGTKRCDAATTQLSIPVTFTDGTTRTYALKTDRRNIMSYFKCDNLGYVASPGQISRFRKAVVEWNRGHLIGRVPSFALVANVHQSTLPTARTVVPFTMNYKTVFFSYNPVTGASSAHRLNDKVGDPTSTIWTGTFSTGWTHLVPFEMGGRTHMVMYKAATGLMKVVRFRTDGQGVDTLSTLTRPPNHRILMPFRTPAGHTFLLEYASNNTAKISRVSTSGALTQTYSGTWSSGYTSMIPMRTNGAEHALLYKAGTGYVKTIRLAPDGTSQSTVWEGSWTTGWTHFVPFMRGVQARFVAYKSASGVVNVDRLLPDAKGWATMSTKPWETGAKSVSVVRSGALLYTAHYSPTTGLLRLDQITQ